ncbi:MAG TPA: GxxExxY protein [Thermoanaerobaculia bacterium]
MRKTTNRGTLGMMHTELTGKVIAAAIEVHRALGPGLLESAYQECLCHELKVRQVSFERELALPLQYKGVELDCSYRIDLLVDGALVVEIKSVKLIERVHQAQLLTYMKLGGWGLGLLINFNVQMLRNGLRRMVI